MSAASPRPGDEGAAAAGGPSASPAPAGDDLAAVSTGPARAPAALVLEGRHVRLEPLAPVHLDDLAAVGLDPELWRWTISRVTSRDEMLAYIEAALAERAAGWSLAFAIVERAGGRAIGSTRFMNIAARDGRLEIGATWVARPWQRTAVNTEAKYLLLRHAFEELGYRRVELKTDALNQRSRTAIQRLGAIEEGTLRRHAVTATGRVRDTVYYSILDGEWPTVKQRLEAMLVRARQDATR